MRTGLWFSGAGGSGILVGRKEDGSWSPPSGIMLHTAGLGFLVGVDIYDCVVVINTQKALDAFSTIRCTLGGEISAVAGPVGVGGVLETEVHKRQAPLFTYLKSRGFYAGVQVDGTIVIERTDENERFYGERIGVKDILAGKVRHPPYELRRLMETLKAAQGDTNVDQSLLPEGPPPADYEIEASHATFGVPDKDDPDPFGVAALEVAGLEIREAGTQKRPTSEQFEFKPSPTSPIYTTFRQSMDRSSIDDRSASRRSSWRTSTISSVLGGSSRTSTMVDMSTQTDLEDPPTLAVPQKLSTPPTLSVPPPLPPRQAHSASPTMAEIPENKSTDEVKSETVEKEAKSETIKEEIKSETVEKEVKPETAPVEPKDSPEEPKSSSSPRNSKSFDDIDLDEDADDEEPTIIEVHQASAPQVINRARIVTVAKPIPPKLPARNPFRTRLSVNSDLSNEGATKDAASGPSPMAPLSPSTPSLKHDGSSTSSKDSISSVDMGGIEHIRDSFQPKETPKTEKAEVSDSAPDSPIKNIPGGFR